MDLEQKFKRLRQMIIDAKNELSDIERLVIQMEESLDIKSFHEQTLKNIPDVNDDNVSF